MHILTPPARARAAVLLLLLSLPTGQLASAQTAPKQARTKGQLAPKAAPAAAQSDGWAQGPSMPTPRFGLGAAVLNNSLYAIGGYYNGSAQNVVEVFDPTTNAWSSGTPLPTKRAFFAAAVIANKLYVVAGTNGISFDDVTQIYDPTTISWSPAPSIPLGRSSPAAAVLNGKLYVIGGSGGGSGNVTNTVQVYDPMTGVWGSAPPMPTSRSRLAAAVIGGKLYAIGGYNDVDAINTVEVYDPVSNSWSGAPALPTARSGLAAAVLGNKLYAVGGNNGNSLLNTMEVYDPTSNAWSTAPAMPTSRNDLAVAALNNKLYAIGGFNGSLGNFLNTVEVFTPPVQPGDVLISEFRLDGPNGVFDEYMEFYNNTDQAITVATSDGSAGWVVGLARHCGLCPTQEVVVTYFVLPNGTTIPARRHLLWTNERGYSLKDYGGANQAVGDVTFNGDTYTVDFGDGYMNGVALFTSANQNNWTFANRLDAVGTSFNSNSLFVEGTGLDRFFGDLSTNAQSVNPQYAFVRKLATGVPQDTNNNAADFDLVSNVGSITTDGPGSTFPAILGAPGPENTQSPVQRNAQIKASLIEPQQLSTNPPNRVRDFTPVTNGAQGTLEIRRRFKNATGQPVTKLRVRIVDVTTLNTPNPGGAQADLRFLDSVNLAVTTSLGNLTLRGTVVETPPAQTLGGGLNSSAVINLPGPLAPGATTDVRFVLGVQANGRFRFLVNVEALP
ncbi:MAG: kelch repeat-containing protein [Pyrinomonadaceae bacterium]